MKYYFCLVPAEDAKNGANIGKTYAYKNRSKWIEKSVFDGNLTVGFNQGVDFIVHDNKAYMLKKNFIDIDEGFFVLLCIESTIGADN